MVEIAGSKVHWLISILLLWIIWWVDVSLGVTILDSIMNPPQGPICWQGITEEDQAFHSRNGCRKWKLSMLLNSESFHWWSNANRWSWTWTQGGLTWRTVWEETDTYTSTVFLLLVKAGKHSLSTKGDRNLFNMKGKIELGFILFPFPSSVSFYRKWRWPRNS